MYADTCVHACACVRACACVSYGRRELAQAGNGEGEQRSRGELAETTTKPCAIEQDPTCHATITLPHLSIDETTKSRLNLNAIHLSTS